MALTVAALATVAAGLGWVASWLGVPRYVLPRPGEILAALIEHRELLGRHLGTTAAEVLSGFTLGNGVAILAAILLSPLQPLRQAVLFLAVALRSVPVIAVTPVLALWLGTGMAPRVVVVALLTFFPTLVVTVRGLTSADPLLIDWMRTLQASPLQVLLKVRIPTALPHVFSGLRTTAPIAVFGALVAEWLAASQGIGHLMAMASYQFRTELLWSAVVVAAGLGLAAYGAVVALERWLVPWSITTETMEA